MFLDWWQELLGYRFLRNKEEDTVSKKLKGFLISVDGNADQAKWETRKTVLSSVVETTLVDDLKDIKIRSTPALDWTHIRDWCKAQHSKKVGELGKNRSDNIDIYCTYRIDEKLSKGKLDISLNKDNSVWTNAWSRVNQLNDDKLSDRMKAIKRKGNSDHADAEDLKTMCSKAFVKPYRNDEEFKDVNSYCTV